MVNEEIEISPIPLGHLAAKSIGKYVNLHRISQGIIPVSTPHDQVIYPLIAYVMVCDKLEVWINEIYPSLKPRHESDYAK